MAAYLGRLRLLAVGEPAVRMAGTGVSASASASWRGVLPMHRSRTRPRPLSTGTGRCDDDGPVRAAPIGAGNVGGGKLLALVIGQSPRPDLTASLEAELEGRYYTSVQSHLMSTCWPGLTNSKALMAVPHGV